jgi:hypothetical protein
MLRLFNNAVSTADVYSVEWDGYLKINGENVRIWKEATILNLKAQPRRIRLKKCRKFTNINSQDFREADWDLCA